MEYDVVIVGAGVAGALFADRISKSGMRILILEAGPEAKHRNEYKDQYWSSLVKTPDSPYVKNVEAPTPNDLDPHAYYVQKGLTHFRSGYERMVGGTTWHWLGTALRFRPNDFKMKSLYGKGVDWPLAYEDIESWYDLAEKELGVAGDSSSRKTPFPKRMIELSYSDKKIRNALEKEKFQGYDLPVVATAQARDPDLCMGSRTCIPLCPMGAKYEARVHVERAVKKGVELRAKSVVHFLDLGDDGRIKRLQYTKWDGSKEWVRAKHFVLAGNAMEIPKLLLMSGQKSFHSGLSNSSDCVGRYLMDHVEQLSWALTKEPVYSYRGPRSTAGIERFCDGDFRKKHAAFRIELSNEGWQWPTGGIEAYAKELIDQGFYGKALREALQTRRNHELAIFALTEQLPEADNRVQLSDKKDVLGLPRPEIHYNVGAYEKSGMQYARKVQEFVYKKLGVTEMHFRQHSESAGHIMGTTRMGLDPRKSVVDTQLRSHDHPNLFILGSGVFPSSAAVNPTLTIAALSLKAASDFLKNF